MTPEKWNNRRRFGDGCTIEVDPWIEPSVEAAQHSADEARDVVDCVGGIGQEGNQPWPRRFEFARTRVVRRPVAGCV